MAFFFFFFFFLKHTSYIFGNEYNTDENSVRWSCRPTHRSTTVDRHIIHSSKITLSHSFRRMPTKGVSGMWLLYFSRKFYLFSCIRFRFLTLTTDEPEQLVRKRTRNRGALKLENCHILFCLSLRNAHEEHVRLMRDKIYAYNIFARHCRVWHATSSSSLIRNFSTLPFSMRVSHRKSSCLLRSSAAFVLTRLSWYQYLFFFFF